ncbi:transporter substrate-binding domain-containing protein [Paenibacillus riograndensis]|uniref:Amino acid ABC transporter n=2 Tax=Paenibacillus riograndensis TaxID=483937 RepID=A0A132U4H3_9BACL|nr:transporter substrate-binding domain-containing protein [Paenibacillus riograndensis]KWX78438.1 amino acid ABC transporter [Paenibacillus riograndensis]KWX89254.1 amino acid ABC transporter [Paenibacillus riograndensis]CQR56198.1 amino acid ABC transporter substrate-binding protein [Paenibacillus riograndensis SBR5]
MNKWGKLSLGMLLVAGLMTGCGNNNKENNAATGNSAPTNSTTATKTLTLGTSADFPPYEFHKVVDGKDTIVGFDIEIAKEIAADMGAKLEIKDLSFDSLLNELSSGRVDMVISGLSPTPERAKAVGLSDIYYKAEQAVVVREADKDKFATMDSLKGIKLGVQTGSIQEDIAKGIEGAQLTSLGKISEIVLQLQSNRVDASIMEGPVAKSFVKNVKGLAITDAKPEVEDDGYVIGVKKGNDELLGQVNKTLARLNSEGKIDEYVAAASELAEK